MKANRHDEALVIMKFLFEYVHDDRYKRAFEKNCAIMITYNYAWELEAAGSYYQALGVTEAGRNICIVGIPSMYLPGILATKARCFHHLGDTEKSKNLYQQAYYMNKAFGDERNRVIIQRTANSLFGIDLT